MEIESKALGGVLLSSTFKELKQWVVAALEEYEIESHGSKYSQKLIAIEAEEGFSVCFYQLLGYSTDAENAAFEHAEFVLDGFLEELEETKPKGKHFAFAHVGGPIEEDEYIGFKSFEAGLRHFKTDLDRLAALRIQATTEGEVLWEVPK